MTFFEWLASTSNGEHHEVTLAFRVLATASLLTFGVLLGITGKLVVDACRALLTGSAVSTLSASD